jgi:diguanylate cyclase (GGDEF)-like protein
MAKILVVDDIPVNRELVVTLLRYRGHESLEAADGAEALALVLAERPQLVISDILMPTMDGYEFVRRLRADPAISSTEVIFYSAHYREQEARSLALSCGVSRVIVKPCDPEEILRVIDEALAHAPAPVPPVAQEFDREHLRLMTDKLSEKIEELTGANRRLGALTDLNLQLASESDPRLLLEKVCRGARDLIGATYAVLCVEDKTDHDSAITFTSGIDAALTTTMEPASIDRGSLGKVQAEQRPLRTLNRSGDPAALGLPQSYPPVHSCLAAPVTSLTHSYGWICLADKIGAGEFRAEDEQVLSILAAQVGRIYENGSLYREVRAREQQLRVEITERETAENRVRRLNRVYAVLSGINTLIVRVHDREELFREACRIAVEDGKFNVAWIGVADWNAMKIVPVASAGAEPELLALIKDRFSLREDSAQGHTMSARAAREQKAIVSNEIRDDARILFTKERLARGIKSMAILPLLVSETTAGVLALYADEAGFFDDEEMKLLMELAGDIGFALDHIDKAERLNYLAYYDDLTGLANSTLMQERLAQYVITASRDQGKLALMLLDVERFKSVNDTLGRHAGDDLLKQIARRLLQSGIDPAQLARLGADQFAYVVPDLRTPDLVGSRLEQRIKQWFDAPFQVNGTELRVAVRVGIAVFPEDGADAGTLFRNAEAAVKKAKTSGAKYLFYTARMTERVAEKLALENQLRLAIERNEFVLHYQPKLDSSTGKLAGAEALIRWNDPQTGLVPPGRFIPILEETGLIHDVGRWALRQAVQDTQRWRAAGLAEVRIAVNVSPLQLRQQEFDREISEVVGNDTSVAAGLELEITESLIMEDVARNISTLQAIRDMGVTISVDDFGTGYSSLSQLSRLPVDTLKIDRSFVMEMTEGPQGMALVSTIIKLAHALNLKVVAEGVETEQQSRLLRLLNCDQMQGYLFSKPIPAKEFEAKFLARQ